MDFSNSSEKSQDALLAEFDRVALQTLINAINDPTIIFDLQGRRVMVNQVAEKLYLRPQFRDITLEERIKRFPIQYPNGELIPVEQTPLYRALQGEAVKNFECQINLSTSLGGWQEQEAAPLFNRTGQQIGVLFISRDITARKQREQDEQSLLKVMQALSHRRHLQEVAEEIVTQVRQLLGSDKAILWQYDEETDRFTLLSSYNMDTEFMVRLANSRGVKESVTYQVAHTRQTVWQQNTAEISPEQVERRKFIEIVKISSFVTTPLIFQNKVVGVLSLMWSVEQIDLAYQRIMAIERMAQEFAAALYTANLFSTVNLERLRLRTVLDSIPLAVVIVDAATKKIDMVNQATRELWQDYSMESLPLNEWPEAYGIHYPDGRIFQPEEMPIARVLRTGQAVHGEELLVYRKNGPKVPVLAYHLPFFDENNKVVGVVATFQDLTESKRMMKLEADNIRLHELNRLRTNFLANISHELRTPLSIILGFNELLGQGSMGELSENQQKAVNHIQNNAKQLLRLIENLLQLANMETEKEELFITTFNPVEVATEVIQDFSLLIERKGLKVEVISYDTFNKVQLDYKKVQQILAQLLSNAIKFSPERGQIIIEFASLNSTFWSISVSDEGKGIDPAQQGIIFEKFRQGDEGYTRQAEGLGIGLSVASHLAHTMAGYIDFFSEIGKGSRFRVVLPHNADILDKKITM